MHAVGRQLGRIALGACVLIGMSAVDAAGQIIKPWTGKGVDNVNGGKQTKARTQTMGDSFVLYDETARWDTAIGVGSSSIFDISGGVRLWQNLAVGVGVTTYSDTATATVAASVPDPLFFDRPHASSLDVTGLEHKERAVHLSAVYVLPIVDRLDVMVSAGPSFFSLKKDLVTDVTVPSGGTSISAATRATIDRSKSGGHIGLDIQYVILPGLADRIGLGVGAFVRYGKATIDAAEVREGKIEVGGLNYGGGLRVRF
jgi:hypothetical protein